MYQTYSVYKPFSYSPESKEDDFHFLTFFFFLHSPTSQFAPEALTKVCLLRTVQDGNRVWCVFDAVRSVVKKVAQYMADVLEDSRDKVQENLLANGGEPGTRPSLDPA